MPFHNDIKRFNTDTLNHCDVFNDVNVALLQNTLYNKQLIETAYYTIELQQKQLKESEEKIQKLTQTLNEISLFVEKQKHKEVE